MNNKLKIALGLAFTAVTFNASAQKVYKQGTATYSVSNPMGEGTSKVYFTADSNATLSQIGPANLKMLANSKGTYFAILVDVPIASIKRAAVATPDEIDQAVSEMPKFTFKSTSETKTISGFNCKKVEVTDAKSGNNFTAWITNDVSFPLTGLTKPFADAGGMPVQFTAIQQGQKVDFTLKSIIDEKAPTGTFVIGPGFERVSLDELRSMGKR
ncbi:MAG: hypothetical protein V4619_11760 [Bacteroidota bacterium]